MNARRVPLQRNFHVNARLLRSLGGGDLNQVFSAPWLSVLREKWPPGWLIQFTLCPPVEERAWHDTKRRSMDAFTNKTHEKMAAWSCPPPLVPPWQARSRPSYICQVRGSYPAPSPWFRLLQWGQTCVYCIYYGMWRKERVGRGAGAPFWCHTEVFEAQRVINSVSSCRLFGGGSRRTPGLIGGDVLRVLRLWSNRRSVSVRAGLRLTQNCLLLNRTRRNRSQRWLKVKQNPIKMSQKWSFVRLFLFILLLLVVIFPTYCLNSLDTWEGFQFLCSINADRCFC